VARHNSLERVPRDQVNINETENDDDIGEF